MRIALTGLLLSLGCKEQAQRSARVAVVPAVVCPDFAEIKARHVVFILIDRSGSVQDRAQDRVDRILDDAAQLVRQFPPATLVFVRYISEDSFQDPELCLIDAIPEEPPPVDCRVINPFDLRQRQQCQMEKLRYESQLRCFNEARERITTALENLAPARAPYTDIWGAVAAASDILSTYPTSHRIITFYSDLHDNVGTRLPDRLPGLKGVKVIVRMARNENPIVTEQRMSDFIKRLSKFGATVQSIPIEVPMGVDGLFGQ